MRSISSILALQLFTSILALILFTSILSSPTLSSPRTPFLISSNLISLADNLVIYRLTSLAHQGRGDGHLRVRPIAGRLTRLDGHGEVVRGGELRERRLDAPTASRREGNLIVVQLPPG